MDQNRGAGEGSIFKRADGRWAASATIGRTPTGKQRRRGVYAATRSEVAEKLRELTNSVAEGIVADPGRLRVSDLVERFLEHKKDSLRPRVHALNALRLRLHVVPRVGAVPLLLAGGADVKAAQRVVGHAQASHTRDVYADFVPDRVDEGRWSASIGRSEVDSYLTATPSDFAARGWMGKRAKWRKSLG